MFNLTFRMRYGILYTESEENNNEVFSQEGNRAGTAALQQMQ